MTIPFRATALRSVRLPVVLLGASLSLAGCISFGPKPPPQLLTLDAASAPAVGTPRDTANAKTIVIQVPATPAALATTRIPVQATPTTIAYVEDAQWADVPATLFAQLVSDTLTARAGWVVLSPTQLAGASGATLGGDLRMFGIDATAHEAVVTYDATLTRGGTAAIEQRRFQARVPVATIDATASGTALNQAANQVAGEVAQWVAGTR